MPTLMIEADRVFDGERMRPSGTVIEINGERIRRVGPAIESSDPGAERARFPGGTALPGFVDLHNYLSIDPDKEGPMGQMYGTDLVQRAWTAARNMRTDRRSGTTTMRVMGEGGGLDLRARQAVSDGEIDGPRLLVAGRPIASSRSHQGGAEGVDGAEMVRACVRRQAEAGVDWIKILLTGGVNAGGAGATEPTYSDAEVDAALNEAARAGLPVAGAAHGGDTVCRVVAAGVRTIEHGALFGESEVDALIRHGATLVLTPSRFFHRDGIERSAAQNPATLSRLDASRQAMRRYVAPAVRSGLKLALGGDNMHGMQSDNVLRLLELGVSLLDALKAATSAGGDALGRADLGRLSPGALADVVVVDGNPATDPACLERVRAVFSNGTLRD